MLEEARNLFEVENDYQSCLLYAKTLVLKNMFNEANEILNKCLELTRKSTKVTYKELMKEIRMERQENQQDGNEEV